MGEEDDRLFGMVDDVRRRGTADRRRSARRRCVPGMSAAVTMVNSSQGTPGSKSMSRMMPRGAGLRTVDAVQHPRQREVVDVARLAGDFAAPFLARNGLTNHGMCTCDVHVQRARAVRRATCCARATCYVRVHVRRLRTCPVSRRTWRVALHVHPPSRTCSRDLLERVADVRIAALTCPRLNHSTRCCGGAVGEALGRDAAALHPLQAVVADGRGGVQRLPRCRPDRAARGRRPCWRDGPRRRRSSRPGAPSGPTARCARPGSTPDARAPGASTPVSVCT